MATFAGKDGIVKTGANTIAEVRSWELSTEAATVDTTVMGDEWESHSVTFKRWSGSVSALWDDTDTNGQETLTEGASITIHFLPEGETTGDEDYNGTATVTQVTRRASHDGIVEADFSFTGNGSLTVGTAA